MDIEERLRRVEDRAAITDLIYLYCRGLDRLDEPTVAGIYHPDAIEDRGLYLGPAREMIRMAVASLVKDYEASQHFIGNVLIELEGDVAFGESYFQAWHRYPLREGGVPTEMIMAGRYLDRFERRAGVWKIAHRRMTLDWTRTQPAADDWLRRHPGILRGERTISDSRPLPKGNTP